MGTPGPSTTVFTIHGPIARSDLPGLCARACKLFERTGADVALCDVDELVDPDLVSIAALARLQLGAQRAGYAIRLRQASYELHDLLAFVGLEGVVPQCRLRLEPGGQVEEREQLFGVEKECELDDPSA
jgi:ABC-type transporter Mla MlaB component